MINLLVVNWTMSICRSDSFNYSIFQTLGTIDLITLWKEIRYAMARFSFFSIGVSPEWLQYIAWWRFTICLLHQSRASCVMRLQICKHTRLLLTHRFMQLSLLIFSLQGKCNLSAITVTSTSDCPFWPAKSYDKKIDLSKHVDSRLWQVCIPVCHQSQFDNVPVDVRANNRPPFC